MYSLDSQKRFFWGFCINEGFNLGHNKVISHIGSKKRQNEGVLVNCKSTTAWQESVFLLEGMDSCFFNYEPSNRRMFFLWYRQQAIENKKLIEAARTQASESSVIKLLTCVCFCVPEFSMLLYDFFFQLAVNVFASVPWRMSQVFRGLLQLVLAAAAVEMRRMCWDSSSLVNTGIAVVLYNPLFTLKSLSFPATLFAQK